MPKENVIARMKDSLTLSLPNGGKAFLFGSRARGEEHEGSDWDVLILLDKEKVENEDYDNISFPLRLLGWQIHEDINPVLYTKEEWKANSFTPFYLNVVKDGIELTATTK